jgi:thiamine-phosphate diphosphorylase/hydroxyethylthiazole kinase
MAVDYSVYLVTDSTAAILGDKDLESVVEAALRGGVTIVQYRDKTGAKEHVLCTARKLHQLTARYGVPLLINDRVDVAVEIGCEGVHIGQDDMGDFVSGSPSPGIPLTPGQSFNKQGSFLGQTRSSASRQVLRTKR